MLKKIRGLYDWTLSWAHRPYAQGALFLLAFMESSFFPIPPDVLLIALAVALPAKAFQLALITTVGSVLGGIAGYGIGYGLMASVGTPIIELYGFQEKFAKIREMYLTYDIWAVAAAGFTPLPYKVFTIAAGAFEMDLLRFSVASFFSRGARFFLLAGLIYFYGDSIRWFIERYFNTLTVLFMVGLVGAFVLLKVL